MGSYRAVVQLVELLHVAQLRRDADSPTDFVQELSR